MKTAIAISAAVLVGAALGVAGYHLAAASRSKSADSAPASYATQPEVSEIRKHLAGIESRLANVEARPTFEEALNNPAMRERLAAIVVEVRGPTTPAPRPTTPTVEAWRQKVADRYREHYAKIVGEARKELKLDDEGWKKVKPIFDQHYAPMETALKDIAAGRGTALPQVNALMAPALPDTLEALKKAVSPEAWKAFDAWRKEDARGSSWPAGKGDYFLDGEDFREYHFRRTVERSCHFCRRSVAYFLEKVALDAEKKGKVNAVLDGHVAKIYEGTKDNPHFTLLSPEGRDKAKAVTVQTEAELAKILTPEQLQRFREWRTAPETTCAAYFGEIPRPFVMTPFPPTQQPQPQPQHGVVAPDQERF